MIENTIDIINALNGVSFIFIYFKQRYGLYN